MISIKTQLEQAVVDALNAAASGMTFTNFTAERKRKPEEKLESLTGVQVMVVCDEQQSIRETRGKTAFSTRRQMTVQIGITKKVGFDTDGNFSQANGDELYQFVDEVADVFADSLTAFLKSGPTEPQTEYHPSPYLEKKGVAACQITAEFWVWVDRRN
jgi:hypothetical protein